MSWNFKHIVWCHEVYNLGAQPHVKVSFEQPEYTADADALGTLRLLECIRDYTARTEMPMRLYQAGSSERDLVEVAFTHAGAGHRGLVAAAKVGGIVANNTWPADFIRDNLAIALNVIDAAYQHIRLV